MPTILVHIVFLLLGCACSPSAPPINKAASPTRPDIDQTQVSETNPAVEETISPTSANLTREEAITQKNIVVHVTGGVQQPGPYELPFDARVQHLVDKAGGITDHADLDDINIAARLIDGSVLTIPLWVPGSHQATSPPAAQLNPPQYTRSGWQPPRTAQRTEIMDTARDGSSKTLLNLNKATALELETLPGIGPKTAAKIIEYRQNKPFATIDDLLNVNGMGPKRVEAIRHLISLQD
jgi:competence protein ComEA